MKSGLTDERLLIRFILGEASEQERAEIEDQSLLDDEFFERLVEVEDELVDAYARGTLGGHDRKQFENHFLAAQPGRDRVKFARAMVASHPLTSSASAVAASKRAAPLWRSWLAALRAQGPVLQYALVALGTMIVLAGAWFLFQSMRERTAEPQLKATTESGTPPPPSQQSPTQQLAPRGEDQARDGLQPEANQQRAGTNGEPRRVPETTDRRPSPRESTPPAPQPVVATFVLTPGLTRQGGVANNLDLPRGTSQVRLQLSLDRDDHTKYRAVLSTPEGQRIWSGNVPKSADAKLTLSLPARLLPRGEYVLELKGVAAGGALESVAEYSFRVVEK